MMAVVSNTQTGMEQVSRKSDVFEEELFVGDGRVSCHDVGSWCCFCAADEEEPGVYRNIWDSGCGCC